MKSILEILLERQTTTDGVLRLCKIFVGNCYSNKPLFVKHLNRIQGITPKNIL